jgi:hypothetical protein
LGTLIGRAPLSGAADSSAEPERGAPHTDAPAARHPELAVFLAFFFTLIGLLLFKNRHLFWEPIHEDGDYAAYSILIERATHLRLLVGNYSRLGFWHPGPATLYVEALGQALFYHIFRLVPKPYNGQALAVILLNSGLVALTLMVLWSASRSALATIAAFAVVFAFGAAHHLLVTTWMPCVYFAPFLLLVVAAASVASGNSRHLWCLALAGGMLIHGHVEFFLFVPATALVAICGFLITRQRAGPQVGSRQLLDVIRFAAIVALFALPIVLNVLLHWPGEFAKYVSYGRSSKAGGHTLGQALAYVVQFWSQDPHDRLAVLPVVVAAAVAVATSHPIARVRQFLGMCLIFVALNTALFVVYALRGIDDLSFAYVGHFYRAAPLVLLVVLIGGAVARFEDARTGTRVVVVGAGLLVLLSMCGSLLVNEYAGAPALPETLAALAAARGASSQPLVLDIEHDTWPDAVGVLVEADREGIRACLRDPFWEFMVTGGFVCDASDLRTGRWLRFVMPGRSTQPMLARMTQSEIMLATAPTN